MRFFKKGADSHTQKIHKISGTVLSVLITICSLTQEQLDRFQKLFAQPESFQPGEVEDALRVEFYSM